MALSETRLRGIFWGGLTGGIASAIPLIAFMNCFCCLWAWVAGAVAVAVTGRSEPLVEKQAPSTGALAGVFAGLVASIMQLVWALVSGVSMTGMVDSLREMMPESIPEGSLQMLEGLPQSGLALVAMQLFSALFLMGIFAGFGALGALLYVRLTKPATPPSPAAAEPGEPPEPDGTAEPE
jgi:hypothetical protein